MIRDLSWVIERAEGVRDVYINNRIKRGVVILNAFEESGDGIVDHPE